MSYLCRGRPPEVQLACGVADEAYWHLAACRKRRCYRCREDIAWYHQRGNPWMYSMEAIAVIIGLQARHLRAYFQPVVEEAEARLQQGPTKPYQRKRSCQHEVFQRAV